MLRRGNFAGDFVFTLTWGALLAWLVMPTGAPGLRAEDAATGEPARLPPASSSGVAAKPVTASAPSVAGPSSQPASGSRAAAADSPADSQGPGEAQPAARRPLSKDPPGMKRLSPEYDVWIDSVKKRVVMDGTVCLRQGTLEMFACLKGTKEHESVVFVDTQAYIVHAGLLAVGAKPGSPARFQPDYQPAKGTPIDITCIWTDEKGTVHREPAQQWVRNAHTQQALDRTWVFAGSGFYTDETTGQKHYLAEGGDFICVSNFPGAMLDLPVESSQANQDLLFEAFTEHIPPRGTRVRLVLTPREGQER